MIVVLCDLDLPDEMQAMKFNLRLRSTGKMFVI
jgi:hypothetical protein